MPELKFPIPIRDLPPNYNFDPRDVRRDVKLGCNVLDPGWYKRLDGKSGAQREQV